MYVQNSTFASGEGKQINVSLVIVVGLNVYFICQVYWLEKSYFLCASPSFSSFLPLTVFTFIPLNYFPQSSGKQYIFFNISF